MPAEPLRVLFVEDSADDAELEGMVLRREGFELTSKRVWTADDLRDALGGQSWDVIIADYDMHGFTGLEALALVRSRGLDVPFLLVSGTVGEDIAAGAIKAGAQDYLMKDRLARLGTAVRRELVEVRLVRQARRAEEHRRLLAEVGPLLLRQIDPRAGIAELAELLVARFADACLVRLVAEGCVEEVGRAVRPTAAVDLEELRRCADRPPSAPTFVAVGASRAALVALMGREGTVGTLAVVRGAGAPDAARDAEELAFLDDLGRRLALAVENGRLHAATKDALRRRDEFLTLAAHELRTPLTALQLQQELLLRAAQRGAAKERLLADLERSTRQTKRLAQLVESVLDTSQLVTGRVHLDRENVWDLADAVRDTVREMQPAADSAACAIHVSVVEGLRGLWDPVRMRQVVASLLVNAIKFGAGRPIGVVLDAHGGAARLRVRDEGAGLAPQDQERIFGCFERAVPSENYGGLGLGLYTARRVVEGHGGTVSVSSELGRGTLFTVLLPMEPAPARAVVAQQGQP